ncbi:MAG: recombinase family protein [Ruminococcus sp.]|nr:recombinase family protein [Ruminococcus sp.]
MKIYGYCRISTPKQKIDRQIDNIRAVYPSALIIKEAYTGTTLDRPAWAKLRAKLQPGDTVVFDEVSRMSRNAAEGITEYHSLFDMGVNLVFLKEPHINTETYRAAQSAQIDRTGNDIADIYIDATNKVLKLLQAKQIALAFESAQKEIDYLHRRTSEGVRRAQADGKPVGRAEGCTVETKKAQAAKAIILDYSKDFNGNLDDIDTMKIIGNISRNSYYKYKRELRERES